MCACVCAVRQLYVCGGVGVVCTQREPHTGMEQLNIVVGDQKDFNLALHQDSIATSAKHVTITIPSLDCVTEEPISHPDSKEWTQPPAWQSLTLAGMVRYALIGRLPIKPLTKGEGSHLHTHTFAVRHASTCAHVSLTHRSPPHSHMCLPTLRLCVSRMLVARQCVQTCVFASLRASMGT